jgi:hypothetical protein
MSKQVPDNTRPESSASQGMSDVHVISKTDFMCCSHAFQHKFQPFVA